MPSSISHTRAILLMVCAATLWSIAGVLTRRLDAAQGFEVTFWRSVFAALFVALALAWQQRGGLWMTLQRLGWPGLVSGLMWCVMFCCFMIALTMTTVANTLIVMSVSPLLTALLARPLLRQRIARRTWLAILFAGAGMVWMFAGSLSQVGPRELAGMAIACGVPLAASINVITMKKSGQAVDLVPAVMMGGVFSALLMLPLAWPLQASAHDIGILATLGVFQLGLPCMLMVIAARSLAAPELSLLALIEVVLGPLWAWLGAGETPPPQTLVGGAIVVAALVGNELAAMRGGLPLPENSTG
ncbi:MAG: DMT family transporter [Burkholderiaceae bacterium]